MDRRIRTLLATIVLALGGSQEASPRGAGARQLGGPAALASSATVAACAIPDGMGRSLILEASSYEEAAESVGAKRATRVLDAVLRFSDGRTTSLSRIRHELGSSSTPLFETLAYSTKRREVWLFACGRGELPFVAAVRVLSPDSDVSPGPAIWERPANLDLSQLGTIASHAHGDAEIRYTGQYYTAIAAVGNVVGSFYVLVSSESGVTQVFKFNPDAEPRTRWSKLPSFKDRG